MAGRKLWWGVGAAVLALVLIWGGKFAPSGGAHVDGEPGRLGINPWPGYELLYLAEKKGFFKEEGLNVVLKQFSSLEDVRNAFENGSVDGICATVVEMIQAKANKGKQAQVALVPDYSSGADEILALNELSDIKALKGKRIGVEAKSLGVMVLARALELNGLKVGDVTMVYLAQAEMAKAMQEGGVHAVVTYPPLSSELKRNPGKYRQVFSTKAIPGEIVDIVAFDAQYLKAHPELQPALRRVWGRALAYLQANPKDAIDIMSRREGVSSDEFKVSLDGLSIVSAEDQPAYFGADGKLQHVVAFTIQTLRAVGDLAKDPGNAASFVYQ